VVWAAVIASLLALVVACTPAVRPLPQVAVPSPTPAAPVSFPRDAGPHDSLTEWWYYTGHLTATDGHAYGFEFVIFQVERQNQPTGYLSHFAVSDLDAQRFSHQAHVAQAAAPAADFPLDVDGWTLDHQGTRDTISAAMQPGPGAEAPYAIRLQVDDTQKPPALHHGGYIDLPPAGGSYYYSRTRLDVRGSLTGPDGATEDVQGIAWMDHQWGNFVISARGGWDWYCLQLDDQSELMLYVLRSPDGATSAVYGSHVQADGHVDDLGPGRVSSEPLGTWVSPHTGGVYPSGWQLTLEDGRHLTLTPQLVDQELYFPAAPGLLAYWEGAVKITGDTSGVGYVELTGYAP
jgi:predicted secreted hydrolase